MKKTLSIDSILKEIENLVNVSIRSIPSEKKLQFLDEINNGLGILIASKYQKMKLGYKKASLPEWMYRQTMGKTKEGTEIIRRTTPDVTSLPYFDHFGKPNIVPRQR